MKKLLISSFIIGLFIACSNNSNTGTTETLSAVSASEADTVNSPVMTFENTTYDFGQVTAGEKVAYDFKFTNTGKTPLIISNATASCGCTVPDYPHDPVNPGDTGVISVVFNSAGTMGMQNKAITLTSNTASVITELYLTGTVQQAETN